MTKIDSALCDRLEYEIKVLKMIIWHYSRHSIPALKNTLMLEKEDYQITLEKSVIDGSHPGNIESVREQIKEIEYAIKLINGNFEYPDQTKVGAYYMIHKNND